MSRRKKIEEMLANDPNDAFLNYALAKEWHAEGDAEHALSAYDHVLTLHPQYVPAYFQKGQLLVERGDLAGARDTLMHGIQLAEEVGDDHAHGEMTAFLESLE